MKKRRFTGVIVCVAVTAMAFALTSCGGEKEKTVIGDLQSVSVSSAETAKFDRELSGKACGELEELIKGFNLEILDDDKQEVYDEGWFFQAEDEEGRAFAIQFFDRIMSINDDRYYRISEEDFDRLRAFCKDHEIDGAPKAVLSCKAFLESIDYDNVIDYGYHNFSELTDMEQLSAIGAKPKGVTAKNLSRYQMVFLGDATDKSPIESGNLHLVMEKKTEKVVWYEQV